MASKLIDEAQSFNWYTVKGITILISETQRFQQNPIAAIKSMLLSNSELPPENVIISWIYTIYSIFS
jgi:hypothetical protein